MRILYIHQYFQIPSESAATRSYWISQEMIRRGHEVIMVSATRSRHKPGVETIDGIEVHYVKNDYNNYMSPLRKIRTFVEFIRLAVREAQKVEDIDLV